MSADLSVVICSLNGAAGVDRCLHALAAQKDVELQVIVVDDGSTDDTSEVAREHGVTVIRHEVNRGLAAARNTGVQAATAPVVAFLDDDCEPEPEWARELVDAYTDGVVGVGGTVVPCAPDGYMLGYLQRNNPLLPLESSLARSQKLPYRLYLYVLGQWKPAERHDKREVYSLVGANMSFARGALLETRIATWSSSSMSPSRKQSSSASSPQPKRGSARAGEAQTVTVRTKARDSRVGSEIVMARAERSILVPRHRRARVAAPARFSFCSAPRIRSPLAAVDFEVSGGCPRPDLGCMRASLDGGRAAKTPSVRV